MNRNELAGLVTHMADPRPHAYKFLEIRDNGTLIPAVAFSPAAMVVAPFAELENPVEMTFDQSQWAKALIRRVGFLTRPSRETLQIVLVRLNDGEGHIDPYEWPNRTMRAAHVAILRRWLELGQVALIDVRVELGETDKPCESELHVPPAPELSATDCPANEGSGLHTFPQEHVDIDGRWVGTWAATNCTLCGRLVNRT